MYASIDDAFYYVDHEMRSVYRFKRNRSNDGQYELTAVNFSGPYPPAAEPGFDYDSKNHVIGGAMKDGLFYVYDPVTESFSAEPAPGAADLAFHAIADWWRSQPDSGKTEVGAWRKAGYCTNTIIPVCSCA